MPRKSELNPMAGVKFRPLWSQVVNAPPAPDDSDADATPSARDLEWWEAAYDPGGNRRRASPVRWGRGRRRRSADG